MNAINGLLLGLTIGIPAGAIWAIAATYRQWRTFDNYDRGYHDGSKDRA